MKRLKAIRDFVNKYKYGFVMLYFFVYLVWFIYLERTVTTHFHPIYSKLDDFIPFIEVFIIPYYIWFAYIAVTLVYFMFDSKTEFLKLCANMFIGMTICLIIYTIWPNGHYLRVDLDSLGRDNLFIDLLAKIYNMDTATNVFPSIHVYNSIVCLTAIMKNQRLLKIKWLQAAAILLTVSICLSTVMLKQHSILDIFGALALNTIMYAIIYLPAKSKEAKRTQQELSNI